jgi:hypothetical protein
MHVMLADLLMCHMRRRIHACHVGRSPRLGHDGPRWPISTNGADKKNANTFCPPPPKCVCQKWTKMDAFLRTQLSGDAIAMASAVAIGGAKFSGKAVDWQDTKTRKTG